MALSSYATLSLNENAEFTNGVMNGFDGASVEIYKNWVYVRDPKMCYERKFSKPTIAQIDSGHIVISEFDISAKRIDKQDAIFVFAIVRYFPDKSDYSKVETRILAGIGCYGYDDECEKIANHLNIDLSKYDDYYGGWSSHNELGEDKGYMTFTLVSGDEIKEIYIEKTKENEEKLGAKWVGITEDLYKDFVIWLEQHVSEYDSFMCNWYNKIKSVKMNDILLFNQGDAFFAKNGVIDENISQGINEPTRPVFEEIIDQAFKRDKNEN